MGLASGTGNALRFQMGPRSAPLRARNCY